MSKDIIHTAFGNCKDLSLSGNVIDAPPAEYDDALKFSNCTNVRGSDLDVLGGSEDALDINRGSGLEFFDCRFIGRGKFSATIKGGVRDVRFYDCTFGKGKETDIDLGNWSDQAPPPARTTGVHLQNCRRLDGKPIRIRCMWADRPTLVNTPAKVSRFPGILLFFFHLWKKITK